MTLSAFYDLKSEGCKRFSIQTTTEAYRLDLEKKTPEQQKTAENAIKDSKVLAELLEGLFSKKSAVRYTNFRRR